MQMAVPARKGPLVMPRREFSPSVYAAIVKRAMLPDGTIACEGCNLVLGKKPYQVDHTKPDGLEIDKSRKLTVDDGKLLGVECCHAPKTKIDVANIAQAKRREAKFTGAKRASSNLSAGPKERKQSRHPQSFHKPLYEPKEPRP